MKNILLSLVLSFLLISQALCDEFRNFTGSNGKTISAQFIEYDSKNETVKIKLKSGKEQNVRLNLFSKKDQKWIKSGGKDGEDNPFDDKQDGLTAPLRIILSISEDRGTCHYRLEKATEPYKDEFKGKPHKINFLEKTKAYKADDGTIKVIYDFSTSDSLGDIFTLRTNASLDKQAGTMTLFADKEKRASINFSRRPFLPLKVIIELEKYEGANFVIFLNDQFGGTHFEHYFQKEKHSFLTAKSYGKEIFKSKPYPLENGLDCEFEIPFKDKKDCFMLGMTQSVPDSPIVISKITMISYLSPILFINLDEKDSGLFVVNGDKNGIGFRSGIQIGDRLKSVNGKVYHRRVDAIKAYGRFRLGERNTLVVERDGKDMTIEIE